MSGFEKIVPRNREIRVFVSSTFLDMQEERDYLVKFIFPRMRNLCENKGIIWGEVDLRWGVHVTEEEEKEGKVEQKVLKSCLEEIYRNQTIFIGILGERYGWIPENIPDEQITGLSTESVHGRSVTELEIIYGVLHNPSIAENAFFYFRDPVYTNARIEKEQNLPGFKRSDFVEHFQNRKKKLQELKKRIREHAQLKRCHLYENYQSTKELGDLIAQNIEEVINRFFPEDEKLNAFDRDEQDHINYASRFTKFYYPKATNYAALTGYIHQNNKKGLVISGEAGTGKTALLANWFLQFQNENTDYLYLSHFVGANNQSTDWEHLLRRFIRKLQKFLNILEPIPEDLHELRIAFANWLNMAATQKKVVIVIDAVNQLSDRNGALDLIWLPESLSGNIKIIVSTLPGKSYEELKRRNWHVFPLQPLDIDSIDNFAAHFLKRLYGKELDRSNLEKIKQARQTTNPMFLTLLLDELRQMGDPKSMQRKLDEYLQIPEIPALFQKILDRYQDDYEKEHADLVKKAFSFIYASRNGLSESELLDLLGSEEGNPLPAFFWSPLYLAAKYSLIDKSGLLTFSHYYLRQAIQNRFLPTLENEKQIHKKLANYFENRQTTFRKIDEYPWHLLKIEAWHSLADLLCSPEFFSALWHHNANDLKFYWHKIEKSSPLRFVEQNKRFFQSPQDYSTDFLSDLADLSFDKGHFAETLKLRSFLVDFFEMRNDLQNMQHQLRLLANSEFMMGNHKSALKKYKIQEKICKKAGLKEGLQNSYGNQAIILRYQKKYRQALKHLLQQEVLCKQINNRRALLRCYGNMANIYKLQKKYQKSIEYHRKEEHIIKEFGDQKALQIAYGNQALLYRTMHDYQKALALHHQEKEICELLGDIYGLQAAIGNIGHVYFEQHLYAEASPYYHQQLTIAESICHPWGEQNAHYNIAMVQIQTEHWNSAREHLEVANMICQKYGFESEVSRIKIMLNRIKKL